MKHKNLFAIPVLALTATMLFACNKGGKSNPPRPTTYTVTFYSEGQVYATQQVEEHELATKPETDPRKEGHDFIGWFTQAEGGTEWVFSVNEVTEDTDLYAHFELGRVDYTINLLLDGEVAATKTTNSEEQADVVLTAVAVGEGKSLLGYGDTTGTTAADVDYRVGAAMPYADVVSLANEQHVVNLNAIVKTGTIQRLNVAVWTKYVDEGGFQRIFNAYKAYATENSVDYDFLDYKYVEGSSVNNFLPGFQADPTYNIVFPSIDNFANNAAITTEVRHVACGKIVWASGAYETGRKITSFSNDDIVNNFVDWMISDAGKAACDPDYEPPKPYPVEEADSNKLVIGVWGRWMTEAHAGDVLDAWKEYAADQSVSYTEAKIQYYEGASNDEQHPYFGKADYLEAVGGNPAIDVILPVTTAIADANPDTADSDAKNYHITENINVAVDLGSMGLVIGGKNDRAMATLNSDAVTASFVDFVNTEEGKKALDPDYGEQEVVQSDLVVSFYGRFISSDNADSVIDAIKDYFDAQNITYTSVSADYVTKTNGPDNETYAGLISSNATVCLGGASNLASDLETETRHIVKSGDVGSIQGKTGRYCYTFLNGNLANACFDYLTSTEGKAMLAALPTP